MFSWFFSLFTAKPKTVEDAIAGLLKAQADLTTVSEDRRQEAVRTRAYIGELTAQADADEEEATKAQAVLAKLLDITGG